MKYSGSGKMRLLVLTSLYPNSIQPRHGIFVEERLRALLKSGALTAKVIAPVPWFPSQHARFGRYADYARVPRQEWRHGVEVLHPRYPVIPRIGMTLGPMSMAMAIASTLQRQLARGDDFDLIDAHYFYPDGVAAARLGTKFGKPVVITARGTDVNTIAQMPVPGRQIISAAQHAAAVVTVSRALKRSLVELGVSESQITTLRNGVDLTRFVPMAHEPVRAELGISGPVWLTVGNLIELKGVHLAIEALSAVPDATLLVAGQGPERESLRALASRCGVKERVRFLGLVAHDELARFYSAADALILAARSEGMPNVVLEAMACGTAIIATAVGGVPELVEEPIAGALMHDRTAESVAAAWHVVCEHGIGDKQRKARCEYAQRFSWAATTQGQLALFRRVLGADETQGRAANCQSDADIKSVHQDGGG